MARKNKYKLRGYHRLLCFKCNHAWVGTVAKCPKCKSTDVSVGTATQIIGYK